MTLNKTWPDTFQNPNLLKRLFASAIPLKGVSVIIDSMK